MAIFSGAPVFAKGANWIPPYLLPLLELARRGPLTGVYANLLTNKWICSVVGIALTGG
jgi:hypothetical protein